MTYGVATERQIQRRLAKHIKIKELNVAKWQQQLFGLSPIRNTVK